MVCCDALDRVFMSRHYATWYTVHYVAMLAAMHIYTICTLYGVDYLIRFLFAWLQVHLCSEGGITVQL